MAVAAHRSLCLLPSCNLPSFEVMRPNDNRFIILKTSLPNEVGYALLNMCSMDDKGGQGVMKIRIKMCAECLVRNAAMDVPTMHDSHKPYNPSGFIIRFTGGKFYRHGDVPFTITAT